MKRFPGLVAVAAGVFFVGLGIWAFADPSSFFDRLATFPPYNEHFLHDVGAFQIGIGATLLLAAAWKDALGVALGGTAIGGAIHAIAHVIDGDLGGKDSDPWLLGALAVVLGVAALARRRTESS